MTSRLTVVVSPDVGGRWRWNIRTAVYGHGCDIEERTGTAVDEYAAWCAVRAATLDAIEQAAVDAATEEGTR